MFDQIIEAIETKDHNNELNKVTSQKQCQQYLLRLHLPLQSIHNIEYTLILGVHLNLNSLQTKEQFVANEDHNRIDYFFKNGNLRNDHLVPIGHATITLRYLILIVKVRLNPFHHDGRIRRFGCAEPGFCCGAVHLHDLLI